MATLKEKVEDLEEVNQILIDALLNIGAKVDSSEQSRIELSNTMDSIREIASEAYGENFDSDLLEHMGYDVEGEDIEFEDEE